MEVFGADTEYSRPALQAALSRLNDYGGFQALSDRLGVEYPDATFNPRAGGMGIQAYNWEPAGNAGQWFPLNESRIQEDSIYNKPNMLASYKAMYPALTSLVYPSAKQNVVADSPPTAQDWERMFPEAFALNPEAFGGASPAGASRPITKTSPLGGNKVLDGGGGYDRNPTETGSLFTGKASDDTGGKEHKGGVGEHLAFESNDARDYATTSNVVNNIATTPTTTIVDRPIGRSAEKLKDIEDTIEEANKGIGMAELQKLLQAEAAADRAAIASTNSGRSANIAVKPPANADQGTVTADAYVTADGITKPGHPSWGKSAMTEAEFLAGLEAAGHNIDQSIIDNADTVTKQRISKEPFIDKPAQEGQTRRKKITGEVSTDEDLEDKATTGTYVPPDADDLNVTVTPKDDTKTYTNDYVADTNRDNVAKAVDDRDAGAITEKLDDNTKAELENVTAEATNLLTSKGWSDSGNWGYARTRNMLTGGGLGPVVTEGALVPWRSQGQDASSVDYISNVGGKDVFPSRVASSADVGGEMRYVPEENRAEYLRQNYGTAEPSPNNFGLDYGITKRDLADMKGDIDSVGSAYAAVNKANNAINNANLTRADFDDVKDGRSLANVFSKIEGLGENIEDDLTKFFTEGLGISDAFIGGLKDVGEWMFSPLDAISNENISFTPFDLLTIATGGVAGLGTVVMGKAAGAFLKPFKNMVKSIFKGTAEKFSDKDIDGLNEWERSLGGQAQGNAEESRLTGTAKSILDEGLANGTIHKVEGLDGGEPQYTIIRGSDGQARTMADLNLEGRFGADGTLNGGTFHVGPDNGLWYVSSSDAYGGNEVAIPVTDEKGGAVTGSTYKAGFTTHNMRGDAMSGGLHNKISYGPGGSGGSQPKTLWSWITGTSSEEQE